MSLLEHATARALLADAEVSASAVTGCRRQLQKFLQRYLPRFYRIEQHALVEVVVQGKLSDLQRKTSEPIAYQAGRQRKFNDRMQLRQDDVSSRTTSTQDEYRLQGRQSLLVSLLARHVPHPADIALPIDDQDPLCAEADTGITEGLGQRCPRNRRPHRQRERDRSKTEGAHFGPWQ